MLKETLERLIEGLDISGEDARAAMAQIMSGEASEAEIGAFLVAMRIRGEAPEHIEGFARVMREACVPISARTPDLVDTCGTGGDTIDTFNISTVAALVATGAGVKIAKHGNRSVSSSCGSADVLAALGVDINQSPAQVADSIDEYGLGFLFAPNLHPAMKYAIGPRRALGIRTVFNILGPLTNPAGASRQLLGVFAPELTETLAQTLHRLGSVHALVVHGMDGLDELSTLGTSRVTELLDGRVHTFELEPEGFGLPRARAEDIAGGDPETSAVIVTAILDGAEGPRRDIVLYNAAAAIYVGGKASGIAEGIALAAESIDSGAALNVLRNLQQAEADHTTEGE
jgi:anthranilate phosphoribosyltransferase